MQTTEWSLLKGKSEPECFGLQVTAGPQAKTHCAKQCSVYSKCTELTVKLFCADGDSAERG